MKRKATISPSANPKIELNQNYFGMKQSNNHAQGVKLDPAAGKESNKRKQKNRPIILKRSESLSVLKEESETDDKKVTP